MLSYSNRIFHRIKQDNPVLPTLESFGGVNFTIHKDMFFNHVKHLIYDYSFDWKLVDQLLLELGKWENH